MRYIKIICLTLSIFLLCGTVSAETLYEHIEKTEITRGVTHSYIERLTDGAWQKINVITADLNDENVDFVPLFDSRGISYKNTLSTLASQGGAVAAINADFFDTTTPSGRTSPIGILIKDGDIKTSASHEPWYATIAETEQGLIADYFSTAIYLKAENGNKMQILHINKYHSTQSVVMFTKDFGTTTPPNTDESVEMIIENGKVLEIVTREAGSIIPENGCVLKVNPAVNNFFAENFEVGDKAEITIEIAPDFDKLKSAAGGGTLLVKDGKVTKFTHNVSGNHPRSAAGISKDGKTLYLVTVEGREDSTPGMSQTSLANLMISLGSYTAINFDGGGSTEMVVRDKNGNLTIANTPSDGGERHISTAVGVKSTGKNGYFSSMELSSSKEYVCIGDYVEIWAASFDNYKNPVVIGNDLTFSADDGGVFTGNRYYPNTPGERTVTVSYAGVSAEIKIKVLGNIASLTFYPSTFEGNSGYLSLIAADENGFKSQLSPEVVTWKIESGKGNVSAGNVNVNGKATISASFSGMKAETTVNNSYTPPLIYDKYRTKISNPDFIIVPAPLEENTFLNKVINAKITQKAKKASNAFSMGSINGANSLLSTFSKTIKNTKIITLRNDISVTKGYDSWKNFLSLENASEKNIVIYLPGGREFSDKSANRMFDKTLEKLYNLEKNVFVIAPSTMPYADLHEGIRFISLKKKPSISLDNFEKTFENADYIKFKTEGNNLYYEISNLFE